MTTQDQIKAIAELDGWTNGKFATDWWSKLWEESCNYSHCLVDGLPNYLTSRDAIIPVIEKQNHHIRLKIESELRKMRLGGYLFLVTPPQLAEALLRATNRWKD